MSVPAFREIPLINEIAKNRLSIFGLFFITLLIIFSAVPWLIAPHSPTDMHPEQSLDEPSFTHPMGTDQHGRDVASRVIFGSRVSVLVGLFTVLIASGIGIPQGFVAGYFGNRTDDIIMRFNDIILSFPSLILAFLIVGIIGQGLYPVIIALGIVYSPRFARIARSSTLSIKENQYVTGAKATGASHYRIMRHHILPNAKGPLFVEATLIFAFGILNEAAFSFLGLGAQPPTVTWGNMIRSGQPLMADAPWIVLSATLFLGLAVLSYNVLGDSLRESHDPRTEVK